MAPHYDRSRDDAWRDGYDAWKLRSPYDDDYDSRYEPGHCPICGYHDDDGHTEWCEFRTAPAVNPSAEPAPVRLSAEIDDDVPF